MRKTQQETIDAIDAVSRKLLQARRMLRDLNEGTGLHARHLEDAIRNVNETLERIEWAYKERDPQGGAS